jgi:voltage-gated potassium channel
MNALPEPEDKPTSDLERETSGAGQARTAAASTSMRRRMYEVLEGTRDGDTFARMLDVALVMLIVLNVAAFIAETVPSLQSAYGLWFDAFEMVSVLLFTIEYLARLWTAPEVPFLKRMPSWKARLDWARTPHLIVDLIAILPFYLQYAIGLDLRIVRLMRVMRLLKLSRYSPAMHTLSRVVYNERRSLIGAAYLLTAAVIFAATGIYFIEHQVQPDKFGSVPDSVTAMSCRLHRWVRHSVASSW